MFHERYSPGVEKRVREDHEEYYKFLLPHMSGNVLDAACGEGLFAAQIKGADNVYCVDIDPDAIAKAKENAPLATFEVTNLDFSVEAAEFIKRYARCFDHIVCLHAIEHFELVCWAFYGFHEMLKPGGSLWVSSIDREVRKYDKYVNPHHVSEMTIHECMSEMISAGFSIQGKYGSRQVSEARCKPTFANKVLNHIFGRPEATSSPVVREWVPGMRYYLIHAIK